MIVRHDDSMVLKMQLSSGVVIMEIMMLNSIWILDLGHNLMIRLCYMYNILTNNGPLRARQFDLNLVYVRENVITFYFIAEKT